MKKSTVEIMREFIANADKYDSGKEGKAFEIAIRAYISGREPERVKAQGKTDIKASANGKRLTCEIKSACGEIETAEKSQVIIYASYVNAAEPAEKQGRVFTREQWKEFLNGYDGRGQFIKHDEKRGHDHIQSFYVSETVRPKASKPIARYIERVLESQPTVEEFFNR